MGKKLYLLAEGGNHTLAYMLQNGVTPHFYFTEPPDLRKYIPYISDKDDVLIIVQGLTDFHLVELYAIINDLISQGTNIRITILSSVKLTKLPITYYLYDNDLFYSKMRGVTNEKIVDLDFAEAKKGKNPVDKGVKVNKVIQPFLEYNKEVGTQIVIGEDKSKPKKQEKSLYESLVHRVDMFSNKHT